MRAWSITTPGASARRRRDTAQGALNEALEHAERELAGLADQAREGALRSLVNHRDGLSVFVDRPQVPMDNNLAERVLRGPVIGRRLSLLRQRDRRPFRR